MKPTLLHLTVLGAFAAGAMPLAASAAPTNVTITPQNGARFLTGQRFDIRVEGEGVGPFSATLAIDGCPVQFTSGAQNTTTTDGISSAGWGGFNVRGYSRGKVDEEAKDHPEDHHNNNCKDNDDHGGRTHTITATFSDSTGSVSVSSQFTTIAVRGGHERARNIIVMLGDGMGMAQRTLARLVRYGVTLGDPNGFLEMDGFPVTGVASTHSLNSIITDSSPGTTCYSTGVHVQNSQEGVLPAHVTSPFYQPRVEYMAEFLHRTMGKNLGLVTTADVEDATPAAWAVHTGNRQFGTGVNDQYLDESDKDGTGHFGTGLTVLQGGGRRWFLPAGQFGSSRSAANDYSALPADLLTGWNLPAASAGASDPARDLLSDFQNAGFTYAATNTDLTGILNAANPPRKLLGLYGYGNMNVALDKLAKRRGVLVPGSTSYAVDDWHAPDQPMLDDMTRAALKVLAGRNPHENDKGGFVLMVEGALIDKQAHLMDAERMIEDTLEFDRAVGVARDFAENVDRRTIVIIVADHECAGASINGSLFGTISNLRSVAADGSTLSPAIAPQRQLLVNTADLAAFPLYNILGDGYPETLDIDGKILVGFGASGDRYETWLTKPEPIIDNPLIPSDIRAELIGKGYLANPVDRDPANGFYIRGQAVGRAQAVHTASDVPISAYSPRMSIAMQFMGVQRNTDVFTKLMRATMGGYGDHHED